MTKQKFKSGRKVFTVGDIVEDTKGLRYKVTPDYCGYLPYLHLEPLDKKAAGCSKKGTPLASAHKEYSKVRS